jgi:hypothetical protein
VHEASPTSAKRSGGRALLRVPLGEGRRHRYWLWGAVLRAVLARWEQFTTIYQTPTATTSVFEAMFNMPGYYRVVAVNRALSLLTTDVSVNITVS